MRVQEMAYLVNQAWETWVDPEFTERKVDGKVTSYLCKNAEQIVSLLEPLTPFSEINAQIGIIYKTHDTFYKGAPGALTPQEKDRIVSAMHKIKSALLTMRSICDALGLEHDSFGFDVKLPPNITLAELSTCARDLDNVFKQCPLLHNDDEQIKLRGVDVGSMWLTFTIICTTAATTFYIVNNLAAIVDKIVAIREHMAVLKQQEELARQTELKTDTLQTIVEVNKAVSKSLIENVAKELAIESGITSPDDIEHIRGSIVMLKEWMDKGMEVYAAVDAPKEVKAAFPPLEAQALPDFKIKELEAHKKDDEE